MRASVIRTRVPVYTIRIHYICVLSWAATFSKTANVNNIDLFELIYFLVDCFVKILSMFTLAQSLSPVFCYSFARSRLHLASCSLSFYRCFSHLVSFLFARGSASASPEYHSTSWSAMYIFRQFFLHRLLVYVETPWGRFYPMNRSARTSIAFQPIPHLIVPSKYKHIYINIYIYLIECIIPVICIIRVIKENSWCWWREFLCIHIYILHKHT